MGSFWDQLRHLFSGPQLPWTILWLGLAALIVGLIVLTRTSWGQSHPLHKCAAMSLLAHLLLAAYATTVQIVTAGSPEGLSDHGPVSMILVNDSGDTAESTAGGKSQNAWDKLVAGAATISDTLHLDRPEPLSAALPPQPGLVRDPIAAKPLLDPSPAILASLVKPSADPSATAAASHLEPAAAIEVPTPRVQQLTATTKPEPAGPDRQPISENDHAASDPDGPLVASADKPKTLVPSPDALSPPPELIGVKTAAQLSSNGTDKALAATPVAPASIDSSADNKAAADVAPGNANAGGNAASENHGPAGSSESRLVMVPVPGSSRESSGSSATGAAAEPKVYRDRTASDRTGIVLRHGGSPETEAAVQAALKWLGTHQDSDGHWDAAKYGAGREDRVLGQDRQSAGARAHTAMTGLALLALLGSGNTHLEGPYTDNVRRGLNYLLSVQGADGNLGGQAEKFAFMYSHGIASFALSESYAMTHDHRLEKPLRAAIGYTLAAQHPVTGGWRYQPHETGDTSQLGWQLMSLKSAELAGIPMPETTRNGVVRFLKSVASGTSGGLGSYRPNEMPSHAMTAEALVCRQFLGMSRDNPAAGEAADYLLGELPSRDHVNLYYWYYGTLGMYQLQGDHWQRWNEALQAALVGEQVTEGDLAGSWDPKCIWSGYGGRIYSTAMSALCLEVYYRFLPLYNADANGAGKPKDAP
ncbi:MAG TPA: hypothetical protein VG056_16610 [Pirellulales bacterium]|jgi:hypothetical protein|nr:hypothetical protein [Pirellulales bacterium]